MNRLQVRQQYPTVSVKDFESLDRKVNVDSISVSPSNAKLNFQQEIREIELLNE
jgi:hypothetical protein